MVAVPRLVAMVLVLGQLQWLPAMVQCERLHRVAPVPCHETAPAVPTGDLFIAADDAPAGVPCPLMQGCAVLTGAAQLAESVGFHAVVPAVRVASVTDAAPLSRTVAPTPPPPEA